MVAFYMRRIKTGATTIDKVPIRWRQSVIDAFRLEVENGAMTEEDFERYTGEEY